MGRGGEVIEREFGSLPCKAKTTYLEFADIFESSKHEDCAHCTPRHRWLKRPGKAGSLTHDAAMFIGHRSPRTDHEDLPSFGDMVDNEADLHRLFNESGTTLTLAPDDTKASLISTLKSGAGLLYIVAHGTEHGGIECSDGLLSWTEFEEMLVPCGLLVLASCFSADAWCFDDEGSFLLIDVIDERTVGAILNLKESHHFPWTYDDSNTHVEAHRVARLFHLTKEIGFRAAFNQIGEEVKRNWPKLAQYILHHEVAIG